MGVTKKDKLLGEAQKMLQKGQLDKAIRGYQDALAEEPGDQRVRQRLAELLARANRPEEARAEFVTVGNALAAGGFYLKAIALFKQVEKLFPEDVTSILALASLNERHGLTAQAMAEYRRAFECYERNGDMAEAVKILASMQKADPQNVNIRLKQAEVLYQLGEHNDAYQVFTALAGLVVERGDEASFHRLIARIGQLFPEREGVAQSVLQGQIESGNAEQAAQLLHALLRPDPHLLWVWQLLVTAYDRLGHQGKLKAVSQHFIKFFPRELAPREYLVRCLLAEQDAEGALGHLETAEPAFVAAGAADRLKSLYLELERLLPLDVRVLKGLIRSCRATGESDLADQYGKKISSLAALSAVPAQLGPEHGDEPLEQAELLLELDAEDEPVVPMTEPHGEPAAGTPPPVPESTLYEIEIELDLDADETPAAVTTPSAAPVSPENWFETVSDIFDTITTTPGSVRYGEGLDHADLQSHYDLGLAFREMGLFDEAINEFRQAADAPDRRMVCLTQQGVCLREKGDLVLAEGVLRSLVTAPGISLEELSVIKYELALTCEAGGRLDEAASLFTEIEAVNPAFRDVAVRLRRSGEEAEPFDFDDDDLLGFNLK